MKALILNNSRAQISPYGILECEGDPYVQDVIKSVRNSGMDIRGPYDALCNNGMGSKREACYLRSPMGSICDYLPGFDDCI